VRRSKESAVKVDLSGVHVLIVEDDEDSRELLGTFLEYCGALVTTCHSTEAALDDLMEYRPHAIVSDLGLPGADGLHFIRALRARDAERGGDLPAIAISGRSREFTWSAAKECGFTGYLVKPVNLEELANLVRDVVFD
jgi:DNA-binding response OmpR family regulator